MANPLNRTYQEAQRALFEAHADLQLGKTTHAEYQLVLDAFRAVARAGVELAVKRSARGLVEVAGHEFDMSNIVFFEPRVAEPQKESAL